MTGSPTFTARKHNAGDAWAATAKRSLRPSEEKETPEQRAADTHTRIQRRNKIANRHRRRVVDGLLKKRQKLKASAEYGMPD